MSKRTRVDERVEPAATMAMMLCEQRNRELEARNKELERDCCNFIVYLREQAKHTKLLKEAEKQTRVIRGLRLKETEFDVVKRRQSQERDRFAEEVRRIEAITIRDVCAGNLDFSDLCRQRAEACDKVSGLDAEIGDTGVSIARLQDEIKEQVANFESMKAAALESQKIFKELHPLLKKYKPQ